MNISHVGCCSSPQSSSSSSSVFVSLSLSEGESRAVASGFEWRFCAFGVVATFIRTDAGPRLDRSGKDFVEFSSGIGSL